jgi:hypothetical protein
MSPALIVIAAIVVFGGVAYALCEWLAKRID